MWHSSHDDINNVRFTGICFDMTKITKSQKCLKQFYPKLYIKKQIFIIVFWYLEPVFFAQKVNNCKYNSIKSYFYQSYDFCFNYIEMLPIWNSDLLLSLLLLLLFATQQQSHLGVKTIIIIIFCWEVKKMKICGNLCWSP